jgi:hypothetical protein
MEIGITALLNRSRVWERKVVVRGDDRDQGMKAHVPEVGKMIPQAALTLADADLACREPRGKETLGREERRGLRVVGIVQIDHPGHLHRQSRFIGCPLL